MTTSNHRPYTYPSGRIDIPSKTGRDGAVKYTDYAIGKLIEYCIRHYHPSAVGADTAASATGLLREIVAATADLAASWMSAGFVHGVLNTDNMVVTGESFDYGPWRFLPYSDPSFTAAYFDEQGLYAFGRQPSAALWNLGQLASCLTLVADVPALEKELERFEGLYRAAFRSRMLGVLGLKPVSEERDLALLKSLFAWMNETRAAWPQVFFDWFGGPASEARAAASPLAKLYAGPAFEPVRRALMEHEAERPERLHHAYFLAEGPVSLVIEEVEALWADISERDDWAAFKRHMARIDLAREAVPTETQVMVKREDEQAFAELNGAYLKFVEDAARLLYLEFDRDKRIADFRIACSHLESLHSHDAVSVICKGVKDGFKADFMDFGSLLC